MISAHAVGHFVRQHLNRTLYSTAYFIALSAIIPAVAGYLFWGLSARLADVEQVGVASALLAASAFLVLISGLDLGTLLIRYLPEEASPSRLINTIIVLRIILAAVVSIIFLIGLPLWSPAQSFLLHGPLIALGFLLTNILQSINELALHIFVAFRKSKEAMIKNVYVALIRFPLLILLVVAFKSVDGIAIYFATMFGILLVMLVVFWRMLPAIVPDYRFRFEFDTGRVARLFRFSVLNYVGEIAFQIPLLIAPVIIVNQLGNVASGIAYIVLMIATMVSILPQGLSRSLLSEGSHSPDQVRHNIPRVLLLSFGLEAIAAFGLVLTGRLLLTFTIGKVGADQGMLFLILTILSAVPMTLVLTYYSIQRIRGHTLAIARLGLLVCVSSLLLIVLLSTNLGLTGVGLGLLIGQCIGAIFVFPPLLTALQWAPPNVPETI